MTPTHPLILILGPTAGGKSRLAVDLAHILPGGGECISADSMQVYRGMDIGTAKPTSVEQDGIPHHLIDIADPANVSGTDGFTVDTWLTLAEAAITDIRQRCKWPIVVGGTNLYIQALLFGLFDGPPPDERLRSELEKKDQDQLRHHLERVDPPAALRIHPNDRKRTIRAIEVFEQTGQRISDLQTQWNANTGTPRKNTIIIGLDYAPATINPRINARVRQMFDRGFLAEVQNLHKTGKLGPQASEALGYKQLLDHLEGRLSLEETIEQIKIRTRRYAKNQRTWLRKFRPLKNSLWLPADEKSPQSLADKAFAYILPGPQVP